MRSGETADVTFHLELGTVTETVVVTDAASPLDTTNSQIHLSVEGPPLRALPVRRDAIQFVLIAPGVAPVRPNNPLIGEGSSTSTADAAAATTSRSTTSPPPIFLIRA